MRVSGIFSSLPRRIPLVFEDLLGDGKQFVVNLTYAIQPSPDGLAQAFIIGADFIGNDTVAMVFSSHCICETSYMNKLYYYSFRIYCSESSTISFCEFLLALLACLIFCLHFAHTLSGCFTCLF